MGFIFPLKIICFEMISYLSRKLEILVQKTLKIHIPQLLIFHCPIALPFCVSLSIVRFGKRKVHLLKSCTGSNTWETTK